MKVSSSTNKLFYLKFSILFESHFLNVQLFQTRKRETVENKKSQKIVSEVFRVLILQELSPFVSRSGLTRAHFASRHGRAGNVRHCFTLADSNLSDRPMCSLTLISSKAATKVGFDAEITSWESDVARRTGTGSLLSSSSVDQHHDPLQGSSEHLCCYVNNNLAVFIENYGGTTVQFQLLMSQFLLNSKNDFLYLFPEILNYFKILYKRVYRYFLYRIFNKLILFFLVYLMWTLHDETCLEVCLATSIRFQTTWNYFEFLCFFEDPIRVKMIRSGLVSSLIAIPDQESTSKIRKSPSKATDYISSATAKYQERFKSLAHHDLPWSQTSFNGPQSFDQSPSYTRYFESKAKPSFDSMEHFDGPRDWYPALKKEPKEDKHFKKMISPFYTITDKDSQRYKDTVLKSGVPYCQEIKTKRMSKDSNSKDSLVCYKCKNPKNGATYEQCSYVSQPMAEASNVDEVLETPSGYRSRRSSSEGASSGFGDDGYRKRDSPYRFSERIFSDGTEEVPSEYKDKDERCEKIMKDSMVCMVCKNTKTNGKYEQCSYVHQPSEKAYAYRKSSSFKNPRKDDEEDGKELTGGSGERHQSYTASKPVREHSSGESRDESKDSSNCRKVEKDSKTCTICRDPDTGGNYEKCSYTYQPNDKVYKFSRSKSFGNPRGGSKEDSPYQESKPSQNLRSHSDDYSRDYSIPSSYYERSHSPRSSSYFKRDEPESSYHQAASEDSKSSPESSSSGYSNSKSESERIAESMDPSSCREVQKDSMTCKVCKDPKTGSNSEQCSYKYQPSDKSYSFTRSKSFGSPSESEDKSHEAAESREPSFKDRAYFEEKGASDRDLKREFHQFAAPSEPQSQVKEESSTKPTQKSDGDFYDAFKKKAEIQKFLQDFRKEDRSNCKKLMRDKMTCYQCVDEKGFRKEECAFVTSEPEEGKASEKEEVEVEPTKKVPRAAIFVDELLLEPEASASEKVDEQVEKSAIKDLGSTQEAKEAEPYEYVAETRPVFDKVLGFTLPAFMLSTSEHEREFDRVMASSY
ncbi:uncharacterized protein LOC143182797 [Calliopsis andreniformis]|uniref:uncharacterized protein LOC143182797 n=1 Tax=Calliopsis andreniformis TaxID=337506 RepID=UPI003FCEA6E7